MSDRRNQSERRTPEERRRARDRKRGTSETYTVIEIAGSDLRVVTLQRSPEGEVDLVHGMTVRWRVEAAALNTPAGLNELTAALKTLAEQHGLVTTHLQFVLGGQFCVTKAVRGTIEEVRNELQQIEQRSRLYLMLGPGEKVTVSRAQPLDARHQHAVAAVCNKQTLETIHEAASRVGMQIDSIEPALVSTSRAIGRLLDAPQEPCLLIHLDQSAVELGVCHKGSLLLDYRPGGRTDPKELVELVRTHLSRLQRHVGRQLREPPPQLKRVYLCGEQDTVEQAYPVFANSDQFEVERIDPAKIRATWKFAEVMKDSTSVPALGALLSTYLPSSERDVPNFMQHIIASTREPLQPIVVRSLLPFAAVLLVALGLWSANLSTQDKIDAIQMQLDEHVVIQARDRELRLSEEAALAKLIQLKALAAKIEPLSVAEVVTRIGTCMPNDVWLSRLEVSDMRSIKLNGISYHEDGYLDFINWLDQAPGFEDVALRSTRPGRSAAGTAVNFNVELNLGDWDGPVKKVARNE